MTEAKWTAAEIEAFAGLVAEKVAARLPPHVCQFSPADAATLSGIAIATRTAKRTSFLAAIGALTVGTLTLIGAGIVAWIKKEL